MALGSRRIKIPPWGDKTRIAPRALQRRFAVPASAEMHDHVYKILELVGSSEKSIEDAIQNAISRASKTIRFMKWFEVVQTRGHIEDGAVGHYQVTLRVGFTLEG
jgi:flavin-binding protein dodecin